MAPEVNVTKGPTTHNQTRELVRSPRVVNDLLRRPTSWSSSWVALPKPPPAVLIVDDAAVITP